MFVSLKRHLSPSESEQVSTWVRVVQLLLQGIGLHAVAGDETELRKFREELEQLTQQVTRETKAQDLLVAVGRALQLLQDYNSQTTRLLRAQGLELQNIIAMLTETLAAISGGNDRATERLQAIEREIEKATQAEDIKVLKVRLADCLEDLRQAIEQQRRESASLVAQTRAGLDQAVARAANGLSGSGLDPLTELPTRVAAEEALARLRQEHRKAYIGLFYVERLQLINSRFGYAAGDQVLIYFAEHLRRNVAREDQIFRWGAAGFVVLFEREMGEEEFHAELSRIASQRLEKTVHIGGRSVLLPVSAHWSMLPIYAEATLEKLVRRIDKFLSDARS